MDFYPNFNNVYIKKKKSRTEATTIQREQE